MGSRRSEFVSVLLDFLVTSAPAAKFWHEARVSLRSRQQKGRLMTLDVVAIQPLVALIAGILILLVPRLLNYVVAIYLILIGLIGLWPHLLFHGPH
jgi:hypothetical protein